MVLNNISSNWFVKFVFSDYFLMSSVKFQGVKKQFI